MSAVKNKQSNVVRLAMGVAVIAGIYQSLTFVEVRLGQMRTENLTAAVEASAPKVEINLPPLERGARKAEPATTSAPAAEAAKKEASIGVGEVFAAEPVAKKKPEAPKPVVVKPDYFGQLVSLFQSGRFTVNSTTHDGAFLNGVYVRAGEPLPTYAFPSNKEGGGMVTPILKEVTPAGLTLLNPESGKAATVAVR